MNWLFESIREDAAIDFGMVVDRHVGDKLTSGEKMQLIHELLAVADYLSRERANEVVDQLGDSLRRAMGRYRGKMPRAVRGLVPPTMDPRRY